MIRKTYAAKGLLDFQMALNIAGAIIRIRFTGGSMASNGVISAKYTTDNAVIQKYMELSPQWKEGRVYLFSEETKADKNKDKKEEKQEESAE